MRRHSICIIAISVMIFLCGIMTCNAESSGTCGDDLTWTLSNDGTLTISGYGEMDNNDEYYRLMDVDKNGSWSRAPWDANREKIKKIVIEEGVENIGDYAFCECSSLSSVTMLNTIAYAYIGECAFSGCSSLIEIIIPDGITYIGNGAFGRCKSLSNVILPESLTTIGPRAFSDCDGIKSITIPGSVTSIGCGAFASTGLTDVVIPDSVTSLEWGAFTNCKNLRSVMLPNSLKNIAHSMFEGCKKLTSITIPEGIQSIGEEAFAYCNSLSIVTIPDSVNKIEKRAFYRCKNLKDITIPSKTTKIGSRAIGYYLSMQAYGHDDSYSDVFIHGIKGSPAHSYAKKNELGFVDLVSGDIEYSKWYGNYSKSIPAPKGIKIKPGKGKITVSWKKLSKKERKKYDAVEVQVVYNKYFTRQDGKSVTVKKGKTSATVKGLSKIDYLSNKTFYVRVRNVKGNGRHKTVSKWSKTKRVVIR